MNEYGLKNSFTIAHMILCEICFHVVCVRQKLHQIFSYYLFSIVIHYIFEYNHPL
jgi:hypothetical protein